MSDFDRDNDGQRKVRDLVLGPGYYGIFSFEGRYVYIDKGRIAPIIQKRFAVDTIAQGKENRAVGAEEKIVRWTGRAYTALTLETMSCTIAGRESDGWMKYGQADLLVYAMCQEDGRVLVYAVDFQKLQEQFWPVYLNFKETITEQRNRTACRIVPLRWIKEHVGYSERMIHPTAEGREAVIAFNATHYKKPFQPVCLLDQPSLFD